MNDGMQARLCSYVARAPRRPYVRIGDEILEFPDGTTNEEAQSALNHAWAIHMKRFTDCHDPGDEDTER